MLAPAESAHAAVAPSLVRHFAREGADVYIGRPSPYGNPFRISHKQDRSEAVRAFAAWIEGCPDLIRAARRELAGKTLGCWCAPQACHGDILAKIANDPTRSAEDPVLVFGSNTGARHGKGAAAFAARWRGASREVSEGRAGRSYALPTKDAALHTLPIATIAQSVERFLLHAHAEPSTAFDVTAIGCGLAGHTDEDIAPLFAAAPANCRLPYRWQRMLNPALPPRIIVAGSRGFNDDALLAKKLAERATAIGTFEIISGGAKGADQAGEQYAIEHGINFVRVPAEWNRYGKAAGMIRNQHMSFLASHLVAFWDGRSHGTRNMIDTAKADRLDVDVVRFPASVAGA